MGPKSWPQCTLLRFADQLVAIFQLEWPTGTSHRLLKCSNKTCQSELVRKTGTELELPTSALVCCSFTEGCEFFAGAVNESTCALEAVLYTCDFGEAAAIVAGI